MIEEAPGLWRLPLLPLDALNVYVLGDVLVDSGARFSQGRILRALEGRKVSAHAITHAHSDHQGSSHAICSRLALPLLCGGADRAAMESGDLGLVSPNPRSLSSSFSRRTAGRGHPVSRTLVEGDVVGGFTVLETPGHTPGHLSYWREQDRSLILGDVAFHRSMVTFRKYLHEPFAWATHNIEHNRASATRLAELKPELICFGHGPPLRDGQRFADYVAGLGSA